MTANYTNPPSADQLLIRSAEGRLLKLRELIISEIRLIYVISGLGLAHSGWYIVIWTFLSWRMIKMIHSIFKKLLIMMVCYLILLMTFNCEKQLPSEFQKKDYKNIADVDSRACFLLSRDSTRTDTLIVGSDTTFTTIRFYCPITAAYLEEPFDSIWANASDSLIQARFDTLLTDTTLIINNSAAQSKCYAYYENSDGTTSKKYFFISWDLTEENLDAYIEPDLFNKSGERMKLMSDQIDLATIAGCTEAVEIGGIDVAIPKIRARYVYELPPGKYLVKFYISEPETIGNFRLVIL